MRPPTSWAHRGGMFNAFYGTDATRQLIAERQESLRRSVEHSRRDASSRRKAKAKARRLGMRTWLSPRSWTLHRPQPRSASACA